MSSDPRLPPLLVAPEWCVSIDKFAVMLFSRKLGSVCELGFEGDPIKEGDPTDGEGPLNETAVLRWLLQLCVVGLFPVVLLLLPGLLPAGEFELCCMLLSTIGTRWPSRFSTGIKNLALTMSFSFHCCTTVLGTVSTDRRDRWEGMRTSEDTSKKLPP